MNAFSEEIAQGQRRLKAINRWFLLYDDVEQDETALAPTTRNCCAWPTRWTALDWWTGASGGTCGGWPIEAFCEPLLGLTITAFSAGRLWWIRKEPATRRFQKGVPFAPAPSQDFAAPVGAGLPAMGCEAAP